MASFVLLENMVSEHYFFSYGKSFIKSPLPSPKYFSLINERLYNQSPL